MTREEEIREAATSFCKVEVALEGLGFGHIMTDGSFLWNKYILYKMSIKELLNLYKNLV